MFKKTKGISLIVTYNGKAHMFMSLSMEASVSQVKQNRMFTEGGLKDRKSELRKWRKGKFPNGKKNKGGIEI
jgi:hypothetical protein